MKKRLLLLIILNTMMCMAMDRHPLLADDEGGEAALCDRVELNLAHEQAMWVAELLDSGQEFDRLDDAVKTQIKTKFPYMRALFIICEKMQSNIEYTRGLPSGKVVLYLKEKQSVNSIRNRFGIIREITVDCSEFGVDDELARKQEELKAVLLKRETGKELPSDLEKEYSEQESDGESRRTRRKSKKQSDCCIVL